MGFCLPCLKHAFENTALILLAVCGTMFQIARDKECHHPSHKAIIAMRCSAQQIQECNHCLMQSTFHKWSITLDLNESRCNQNFSNVIHKRSHNPRYSRRSTLSYHPSIRKLIRNWKLFIFYARYICARVGARGDGETSTNNHMGTSRITDRNAVVE